MITPALYQECERHLAWMKKYATRMHGKNLDEVKLVIVPASANIQLGPPQNPAVYVNQKTHNMVIRSWNGILKDYFDAHPTEVRAPLVEQRKSVMVNESALGEPMLRVGILWHEFGHALADRLGQGAGEPPAYAIEVELIDHAYTVNYLHGCGIGQAPISSYLDRRQPYFNVGCTPKLTKQLNVLRTKLRILTPTGFAPRA